MAVGHHPTTITVPLAAQAYPIVLGPGSLASLAELLMAQGIRADTRVLLVTNPEVERHYGATCRHSLEEAGFPPVDQIRFASAHPQQPLLTPQPFVGSPHIACMHLPGF